MLLPPRALLLCIGLAPIVTPGLEGQTTPVLDTVLAPHRSAIHALSALAGMWRGQGWTLLPSGERTDFTQMIRVGPFGEGALKLLEGRSYGGEGRLSANNVEIISYNASTRTYTLRLYSEGKSGEVTISPQSGGFMLEYPAGNLGVLSGCSHRSAGWR